MSEYGFGDQSGYFQRESTLRGGLRVECGEFTDTGDRTPYSHTHFSRLVVGLGVGDTTAGARCRAMSICDGQVLCWTVSDIASVVHWNYIAFGF
jgi:hypothetical protein